MSEHFIPPNAKFTTPDPEELEPKYAPEANTDKPFDDEKDTRRCKDCGGYGRGLLQSDGRCAHCRRKGAVKYDPSTCPHAAKGFVDITRAADGGVLKKVITLPPNRDDESTTKDLTPSPGCPCKVHIVGTLTNGEIFQATRDMYTGPDGVERCIGGDDNPLEFHLLREKVVRGLDVAVSTMVLGEVSSFVVRGDYGYVRQLPESLPKVTMNATLIYEVSYERRRHRGGSGRARGLEGARAERNERNEGGILVVEVAKKTRPFWVKWRAPRRRVLLRQKRAAERASERSERDEGVTSGGGSGLLSERAKRARRRSVLLRRTPPNAGEVALVPARSHKPPLPKTFSRKTQVELLEFGEAIPRFPSKEELAQTKREREEENKQMLKENPPVPYAERCEEAMKEKELGNELFKEGKYEEAKKQYVRAKRAQRRAEAGYGGGTPRVKRVRRRCFSAAKVGKRGGWRGHERSECDGGALLRRKRASEGIGGATSESSAIEMLFCGGSGQARRASGGDPPNPPLRPARHESEREECAAAHVLFFGAARRASGGDPPNPLCGWRGTRASEKNVLLRSSLPLGERRGGTPRTPPCGRRGTRAS
jgi:hypothetical protein